MDQISKLDFPNLFHFSWLVQNLYKYIFFVKKFFIVSISFIKCLADILN